MVNRIYQGFSFSLCVTVAVLTIEGCSKSKKLSPQNGDADSTSEYKSPDEDTGYGIDSEAGREATDAETLAADSKLDEIDSGQDLPFIPADRIVTPATLSGETMEAFINEPTDWDDLSSLSPDSCGYSMTIATSSLLLSDRKVRFFDQEGKLLLEQSDREKTEVIYDQEGRLVSIWKIDRDQGTPNPIIIAVGYNSDGSVVSKIVYSDALFGGITFPDLFDTIGPMGDRGDCSYLAFDSHRQLVEFADDPRCNDDPETIVQMSYSPDGKPQHYQKRDRGDIASEIFWTDLNADRQVTAVWNDRERGDSALHYRFDISGKLIAIQFDRQNDGDIDESTEYLYDERENPVRIATDLDQNEIVDLLRVNTYNEDGYLLSKELRSLFSPERMYEIWDSEFEYVTTDAPKVTTYAYDNDLKLVESISEGNRMWDEFVRAHHSYRYDAFGRLIEEIVDTDLYRENDDGERELFVSAQTTCSFDYSCDNRFDESDELRRCERNLEVIHHLFPYRAIGEIPFHKNRSPYKGPTISVDPEDVLGIPWY